jgi:hypothetical protein
MVFETICTFKTNTDIFVLYVMHTPQEPLAPALESPGSPAPFASRDIMTLSFFGAFRS